MKFYVAVTRPAWWDYLRSRNPNEVNFWRPGSREFRAVGAGAPFLFKLPRPQKHIVGGGFFARHFFLPLSMAWTAFGEGNGAPNYSVLRAQVLKRAYEVRRHRIQRVPTESDPAIGCIILTNPFFHVA